MSKKEGISTETMQKAGRAVKVQRYQLEQAQEQIEENKAAMRYLSMTNDENIFLLDRLLEETSKILDDDAENVPEVDAKYMAYLNDLLRETEQEPVPTIELHLTDTVNYDKAFTWEEYTTNIELYGFQHHIDLDGDVYLSLLTLSEQQAFKAQIEEDYRIRKPQLDQYDYMIAAFCGVAAGLIDAFFVKSPGEGKLGVWTDKKADDFIVTLSQNLWSKDEEKRLEIKNTGMSQDQKYEKLKSMGISYKKQQCPREISDAIYYLEKKFSVNYDASNKDNLKDYVEGLDNMAPMNHHIRSLAHSPDIIGLIFSIIDQFTGKGSYIGNTTGKISKIARSSSIDKKNPLDEFELRGTTILEKLVCAFSNWLGHLCSDYVGSRNARAKGKTGRGSGLGIPFYELLQFCNFGNISLGVNTDKNGNTTIKSIKEKKMDKYAVTISDMSLKLFEKGYDLRFGQAMAIPVILNEFMIRVFYGLRYNEWSFKETPELTRMLTIGYGAFCTIDGLDATLSGKGNVLNMAVNLNVIAWTRFAFSVLNDLRNSFLVGTIDAKKLESDLQSEWQRLYLNYI